MPMTYYINCFCLLFQERARNNLHFMDILYALDLGLAFIQRQNHRKSVVHTFLCGLGEWSRPSTQNITSLSNLKIFCKTKSNTCMYPNALLKFHWLEVFVDSRPKWLMKNLNNFVSLDLIQNSRAFDSLKNYCLSQKKWALKIPTNMVL